MKLFKMLSSKFFEHYPDRPEYQIKKLLFKRRLSYVFRSGEVFF